MPLNSLLWFASLHMYHQAQFRLPSCMALRQVTLTACWAYRVYTHIRSAEACYSLEHPRWSPSHSLAFVSPCNQYHAERSVLELGWQRWHFLGQVGCTHNECLLVSHHHDSEVGESMHRGNDELVEGQSVSKRNNFWPNKLVDPDIKEPNRPKPIKGTLFSSWTRLQVGKRHSMHWLYSLTEYQGIWNLSDATSCNTAS